MATGIPTLRYRRSTAGLVTVIGLGLHIAQAIGSAPVTDLTGFSIEALMQVKVISATKTPQTLHDTAAAVFVISADDIRRSGVTHVMEALQLAPGVQVARIDASRWAITIRGFDARFANKLLVMIDGRTLYNPQFSGVYWEVQDLFLADIDRIEVIRGPGGSLWGANAVNGIINIITKHSSDTQGGLMALTAGKEERAMAGIHYGGTLNERTHYRVYGQFSEHDGQVSTDGRDAGDDWHMGRGGFRLDWTPSTAHRISVQGDVYRGKFDQNDVLPLLEPPYQRRYQSGATASGGSVQARWEHRTTATSQMSLQAYAQHEHHEDPVYIVKSQTLDLDFQHQFALGDHQQVVWGLGYRRNADEFTDTDISFIEPNAATTQLFSAFIQDQAELIPDQLRLIAGVKLEHNDFTGREWQPSLRLLWTPHPQHRFWAAASRAVRTPSRGENDVRVNLFTLPPSPLTGKLPTLFSAIGTQDLQAEQLMAYEIGHRAQWSEQFSLDTTLFYHDYDHVIATVAGKPVLNVTAPRPHVVVPLTLTNEGGGTLYGLEMAADWHPLADWQLRMSYSYLYSDLKHVTGDGRQDHDRHQLSLFSSWELGDNLELDAWWRYVDVVSTRNTLSRFGAVQIKPYTNLSLRLGWRPRKDLELSLAGTNLLDDRHLEYVQEVFTFPVEVERSLYGQLKWSF